MKMNTVLFAVMLVCTTTARAQLKIPGRKAVEKKIEKKVEKTADDILNGKTGTSIPAEETSGPAKSYINSFWKHIEKMKNHDDESNKQVVYHNGISAAKTAMNNTKMKDPGYNTGKMEEALAECQAVYDGLGKSKQNLRDSRMATEEYIKQLIKEPFLFKRGELQIDGDSTEFDTAIDNALGASDAVIKEHEDEVEAFLKTNPETVITQNGLSSAKAKGSSVPNAIKQAEDAYKNDRAMSSVYYLQRLYLLRAYIAGALRIFPGENSLQQNHDLVVAAIEKFGSRKGYMAKLQENYKQWVKNLKIGKAVMSDPAIENLVKKEYQAWGSFEKMTVTKVNLASSWRLEKNSLDIPIRKEVYVNIAFKKPTGECGLGVAYVIQEYEGGGKYGAPYMARQGILARAVPCENLK